MDINEQKKTWDLFTKLSIYGCGFIIAVLVLMAIFLL